MSQNNFNGLNVLGKNNGTDPSMFLGGFSL